MASPYTSACTGCGRTAHVTEPEQRIAARPARQELLGRRPPIAFGFIVEESVLPRHTGGEDVHVRDVEVQDGPRFAVSFVREA
ncbi:Scr1 family TA system antitoxin-like transcriptional regulator [Streptomyces griseoloalbus]|uniref:DUF5753 domain-containing protein n=1 Tax=Streptomyces griseoloalbus TaxID=67303 RepID=A0A7W8F9W4_9ACTN|nr:hypothetical protein [Streptomyces albaduncus]